MIDILKVNECRDRLLELLKGQPEQYRDMVRELAQQAGLYAAHQRVMQTADSTGDRLLAELERKYSSPEAQREAAARLGIVGDPGGEPLAEQTAPETYFKSGPALAGPAYTFDRLMEKYSTPEALAHARNMFVNNGG